MSYFYYKNIKAKISKIHPRISNITFKYPNHLLAHQLMDTCEVGEYL